MNKLWNREARTLIRDHRICLKNSHDAQPDTICKFLADFNKLWDKTMSKGREIPWKGLQITFYPPPPIDAEKNLQLVPTAAAAKPEYSVWKVTWNLNVWNLVGSPWIGKIVKSICHYRLCFTKVRLILGRSSCTICFHRPDSVSLLLPPNFPSSSMSPCLIHIPRKMSCESNGLSKPEMGNRETSNADPDSDPNYVAKIQIHFNSDNWHSQFGLQSRCGLFFQKNANYIDSDADSL